MDANGAVGIRAVDYSEVAKHRSAAAKEHVSLADAKHVIWFQIVKAEEVVGAVGLMLMAGARVRIKGFYVLAKVRGLGIGTNASDAVEAYAIRELQAREIEVYAYNREFYEGRGFQAVGKRPNGAVLLRKGTGRDPQPAAEPLADYYTNATLAEKG